MRMNGFLMKAIDVLLTLFLSKQMANVKGKILSNIVFLKKAAELIIKVTVKFSLGFESKCNKVRVTFSLGLKSNCSETCKFSLRFESNCNIVCKYSLGFESKGSVENVATNKRPSSLQFLTKYFGILNEKGFGCWNSITYLFAIEIEIHFKSGNLCSFFS